MGAVRIAILIAAALAAILLAFIVRGMVGGKEASPAIAEAAEEQPMTRVLVAKQDLAVGARLTPAMLGWQDWPVAALNESLITDGAVADPAKDSGGKKIAEAAGEAAQTVLGGSAAIQAFEGAVAREPIAAGEPITARKVLRGGEGGFMSVVLQPGMRAVAVPISAQTASGGFILPGDRVDVIRSRETRDGAWTSEVLMQNLRVLAIDQTAQAEKDANSMTGAVATLEAPAADADLLVLAAVEGEVALALRAYTDIGGRSGRGAGGRTETVRVFRDGDMIEVSVR